MREAPDGELALSACREVKPHLVLLDVDMPVLNGLATLEQMQADPDLRSLPVLFLTARTSGADAARGLNLGAYDYLKKPWEQAELLARVSAALRQRAREKRLASEALELAGLSTTDTLTRLTNRRGLEQVLASLDSDCRIGVLLVDLDHFKRVDDNEGHAVGDAVLTVAARLLSACDSSSTVARWGGEEFVVLTPHCGPDDVVAHAERLRSAVGSSSLQVGAPRLLAVSASIGAASGRAVAFSELLKAADVALYQAKATGRNRVVAAPGA